MRFGEKLSRWIEETGISANEVARRVGVSPMSVGRWREGKIEPRRDELARTAQMMGVPIGWLADDAQDELLAPDPEREFVAKLVDAIGVSEAKRRLLAPQATLNADPPMVPLPPKPPGFPPLELGPGHATGGRRRKSS
jgi:transcriptional regulator with XRE-family HTH domain